MAKYNCMKCGSEDLSISNFDFYGELMNDENHCIYCNEMTEWSEVENEHYTSEAPKTKTKPDEAIKIFNEALQLKTGKNPDLNNIITIERIGGEDHNPKFKGVMNFENKSAEIEGYFKKKEVKKYAVASWIDEYGLPEIENERVSKNKMAKNVPLYEKINILKREGILKTFLRNDKLHIAHAMCSDFVKGEKNEEITKKYQDLI